tara:strand:+ start:423 stop:638 length:216 start_codon:yes stop_codon:yes gene_type:complete
MIINLTKVIFLVGLLHSCTPKYEVIQKLAQDKYHLQGVKNKEVIIAVTSTPLKKGDLTTLKALKKSNGHIE